MGDFSTLPALCVFNLCRLASEQVSFTADKKVFNLEFYLRTIGSLGGDLTVSGYIHYIQLVIHSTMRRFILPKY